MSDSNNPFKMILPYVGLVLGIIIGFPYIFLSLFFSVPNYIYGYGLSFTIGGFLLGWLITIIYRKVTD